MKKTTTKTRMIRNRWYYRTVSFLFPRYAFFRQWDTVDDRPFGRCSAWGRNLFCSSNGRFWDDDREIVGVWKLVKNWIPVREFNKKAKYGSIR